MNGWNAGAGTGSAKPKPGRGGAKIRGTKKTGGYTPQTQRKNDSYTPQSRGGRKEYSPDRDYNYTPQTQSGPMTKDGDYEPQSKGGRKEYTPQSEGRKEYSPQSGGRKEYTPQSAMKANGDYTPQSEGREDYTPQSQRGGNDYTPQSRGGRKEYIPQSDKHIKLKDFARDKRHGPMRKDEDYVPQSQRGGGDYEPQSKGRKEYSPQSRGREEYTPQSAMKYDKKTDYEYTPQSRGGRKESTPQSQGNKGGRVTAEYTPQSQGESRAYTPQSQRERYEYPQTQSGPMRKDEDYVPQSQREGGDYTPQSKGGRKEYSPQSEGRREYSPQSQGGKNKLRSYKDAGISPGVAKAQRDDWKKLGPMRKDDDYVPQSQRGGGDYEPQSKGRKEYSPQSGSDRDEYTPQSQKKKVDRSPYMKKADHAEADQNNVGTHQGYDAEAGKKATKGTQHYEEEFIDNDPGWSATTQNADGTWNDDAGPKRKAYNRKIDQMVADGMDLDDARAKASKEYWDGDDGKKIKSEAKTLNQRDYAWGSTPNMSTLVNRRNELRDSGDTSSKEYQEIQNRINHAYNNDKRHGEATTTKTSKDGRSSTTTTHTPGIGTQETKTVYDKDGKPKKVKSNTTKDDYYGGEKTKTKYKGDDMANFKDEDGDGHPDVTDAVSGREEPARELVADSRDSDASKNKQRKQYKDTKFGQTGVGQLFVKKNRRNKK